MLLNMNLSQEPDAAIDESDVMAALASSASPLGVDDVREPGQSVETQLLETSTQGLSGDADTLPDEQSMLDEQAPGTPLQCESSSPKVGSPIHMPMDLAPAPELPDGPPLPEMLLQAATKKGWDLMVNPNSLSSRRRDASSSMCDRLIYYACLC